MMLHNKPVLRRRASLKIHKTLRNFASKGWGWATCLNERRVGQAMGGLGGGGGWGVRGR